MAPYRGLFDTPEQPVKIVDDGAGNRTLERTPVTEELFDFASQEQIAAHAKRRRTPVRSDAGARQAPVIVIPNEEYKGATVKIAAETKDLEGLIAYVQKLGDEPRQVARSLRTRSSLKSRTATFPRSSEWIAHGREVYQRRMPRLPRRDWRRQWACRDLPSHTTPAKLRGGCVQVPADQGAAADRTVTSCARSPAGFGERRCRPGMNCLSRIGSPSSNISSINSR